MQNPAGTEWGPTMDKAEPPASSCSSLTLQVLDAVGSDEHREMVSRVKQYQRQSEDAKNQWHNYCDLKGNGSRDPMRHPSLFLRRFFESLANNEISTEPASLYEKPIPGSDADPAEVHAVLSAKVKHGQRVSVEWKQRWSTFCDAYSDGIRDPQRHSVEQLKRFFEEFAPRDSSGAVEDNPQPTRTGPGGRPMPNKDPNPIADRVKQMQRQSEAWKTQWWWYCDNFGGGIRDPERHLPHFLQQFVTMAGGQSASMGYGKILSTPAAYRYSPYDQGYGVAAWPNTGYGPYQLAVPQGYIPGSSYGYPVPHAYGTPCSQMPPPLVSHIPRV